MRLSSKYENEKTNIRLSFILQKKRDDSPCFVTFFKQDCQSRLNHVNYAEILIWRRTDRRGSVLRIRTRGIRSSKLMTLGGFVTPE